jgi:hypothetical protein
MYTSQQMNQSSAHFGPSLTNSYDRRQQIDKRIDNPEGIDYTIWIECNFIFTFQGDPY